MKNKQTSKQRQVKNHKDLQNKSVRCDNSVNSLTKPQSERFKAYTRFINKAWKAACLRGDLIYGCVVISQKNLAKAAYCSTKTVGRDMKLHNYSGKIFRFQGFNRGRKVECERLRCWVGERRYYYGFVRTVKETTNVVIEAANENDKFPTNSPKKTTDRIWETKVSFKNVKNKVLIHDKFEIPWDDYKDTLAKIPEHYKRAAKEEWIAKHRGQWIQDPLGCFVGWLKHCFIPLDRARNKKCQAKAALIAYLHNIPVKKRERKGSVRHKPNWLKFYRKPTPNPCAGIIPATTEQAINGFAELFMQLKEG